MGNQGFAKFYKQTFGKTKLKYLVLGLDCAGKTTFLYKMNIGKVVSCAQRIGYNFDKVQYLNSEFICWDLLSKQEGISKYWQNFFQIVTAIIFIIDSSDKSRIQQIKKVFQMLTSQNKLQKVPFLILANKSDMNDLMSSKQIQEKLNLQNIKDRQWHIQSICSLNGNGFEQGFKRLHNFLNKNNKQFNKMK